MQQELYIYLIVFLYGIIIGSFLNVLIYRIPKKEDVIIKSSSCTKCGHRLQWYDLIPLFSYICLKGRCRYCNEKISRQYPIIEALNAIVYVLIYTTFGIGIYTVIVCLFSSILIAISIIDFRTYIIPDSLNVTIFLLALISLIFTNDLMDNIIGFFIISGIMLILLIIFRHLRNVNVFGGGDIKLMAVAGLFLGAKLIVLAFFIGCILGSVIHSLRMKFSKEGSFLAFGPYLCAGIFISVLFGRGIIDWYISLLM